MIVYQADKRQFLTDNDDKDIEEIVRIRYQSLAGKNVGNAELRSWRESLSRMAAVLRDEEIPLDAGVAVEFHIPQSSKRIDMTLTGLGDDDTKNMVIVELKQWEKAQATKKDAIVITFLGKGNREVVHPSYQAWSYAALLEGFNTAVYEGGIDVHPCAYLHNYPRDGEINAPQYDGYVAKAPLFLRGEAEKQRLREFIRARIRKGDGQQILYQLESGKIRPSKALADSLVKMIKGRPEFVLIDEQKSVFEAGMAAGQTATPQQPNVVIVEGGPGTGKTVVAINLLVALTAKGLVCAYVSKNAAPRAVYAAKLAGTLTKTRYGHMFVSSGTFMTTPADTYDVLIVDEAHRLNEKSGFYGNEGDHQIKEIVASSKCSIFFIDEDQRVTLRDIGSKQAIADFASARGAAVETHVLASQFRCSGSDGYIAWIDNTLGIRETANTKLSASDFDFRVFDSPSAMHAVIEASNSGNKARVVAGYCWPWESKKNPAAMDIVIGPDYRKQWNLGVDGSLWIIAESSIDQVGCIHTCQGLELDYVGVIVGPDFLVRNGCLRTVPEARARQDQSLKGFKQLLKIDAAKARQDADIIIKNTYRTLMTRGMKGCYVYCTDAETAEYFRQRTDVPEDQPR